MPGTATATIRGGTIGDRSRIARILTEVFTGGDVAAWIVPEPDLRRAYSRGFFDHAVEHALLQGTVHIATDHDGSLIGAALWLPHPDPNVRPAARTSPPPRDFESPWTCGGDMRSVRRRQQLLDRLLDLRHPQRPHHHLAYLGVRPDRQGQGIGSQLLLYHHAFLHAAGIPAYLQADHPGTHDLYQRHGYTSIGPPVLIPDTGVSLWAMWREPVAADYVLRLPQAPKNRG